MKNMLLSLALPLMISLSLQAQNVGIGTANPIYKLQIVDGPLALTNTAEATTWLMYYHPTFDGLQFITTGTPRLTISNLGNVGIGTSSPDYKLEVIGNTRTSLDLTVGRDATVTGDITVANGKGILRNGQSSAQLKYYTFTAPFTFSNFGGHSTFGPVQVNFPAAAAFSSTPRVIIGNYTYIAGTAGHLFSIVPAVYSVNTTGFQIYFFNSSTSTATMNFTLSFVCIGGG